MAQLSPVRFRALDASGALVVGAGLFVYEVGTSTLAALYSDADLMVATANPVISGATGYWAQFYTVSGETFDIQARATSSVGSTLLWEALEVDSVGSEDTGTFLRDFGGNGRVQIVGATGVPRVEFGPPLGDNIGGGVIFSGWAGTDIESATWRGPLSVTGALTGGTNLNLTAPTRTGSVEVLLASGAASGVAALELDLDADFNVYRLELAYLVTAGGTTIEAVLSFDGATYKTGADDYAWRIRYVSAANTLTSASDLSDDSIAMFSTAAAVVAGTPNRGSIDIVTLTGAETGVSGHFASSDDDAAFEQRTTVFSGGTHDKNYGKASKIKLLAQAGNISVRYALFGVPGL